MRIRYQAALQSPSTVISRHYIRFSASHLPLQVFPGRNPLLGCRRDFEAGGRRCCRTTGRHVYSHCDHWPAHPQLGHPAAHLSHFRTQKSLQIHGWSPGGSLRRLWDFIQVRGTPRINSSMLLPEKDIKIKMDQSPKVKPNLSYRL